MVNLTSAPASVTVAMLLADARLPSGGHAHSAGLEPALLCGGLRADAVPDYLHARAASTVLVEAGTAVVARHLAGGAVGGGPRSSGTAPLSEPAGAVGGGPRSSGTAPLSEPAGDAADLWRVERAWAARTPSDAMREASRVLARGYLRLATTLWPSEILAALHDRRNPPPRAVVLGVIAAEAGMAADDLVRHIIYDETASAAAALLKLEPRDPAQTTAWVLDVCARAEPQIPAIAALTDPQAIPAAGAPESEMWAQAHATLTQRLFRA